MPTPSNFSTQIGATPLAYHWPHLQMKGWQDSDEQREVSLFLLKHEQAFVLSDMRTGKTLSTLWAIDQKLKPGEKALILTKKSTMIDTWLKEAKHLQAPYAVRVISGSLTNRLQAIKEGTILIANHDVFKSGGSIERNTSGRLILKLRPGSIAEALFKDHSIKILVLDEVTAFRNLQTNRTWLLRNFMRAVPTIWALTGTPNPSSPLDAHGLARVVRPDYKESRTAFQLRTMVRVSQWTWRPIPGVAEVACAEILTPSIRFTYGDVFEADTQEFKLVETSLSEQQERIYKHLLKEKVLVTTGEPLAPANEAAIRTKLLQIASGGFYEDEHLNLIHCATRLFALKELTRELRKFIIYVPFSFNLPVIFGELPGGLVLTSEMSAAKRAAIFDNFRNNPTARYLIADPGLMAHGLNLSVADTIIYWGPIDRHETWQQANRRVVKPGGSSIVYMIAATPLERRVYENARKKESFQGLVLEEVGKGSHE